MTNQHPLTDEIAREFWLNSNSVGDSMRAAADWQLEEVIYYLEHYKMIPLDIVLRNIRIAMRPTTQENN